jgi:hypothetical protein
MKRGQPVPRKDRHDGATVLALVPGPVRPSLRSPGEHCFSGACMRACGALGDDAQDERAGFPDIDFVVRRLIDENDCLAAPAVGLCDRWRGNRRIMLADVYAQAMFISDEKGDVPASVALWTEAMRLRDGDIRAGEGMDKLLEVLDGP